MDNVKVADDYKDRLFRMIFNDKEKLLELYNAMNRSDYTDASELQVVTLENAIYLSMKNDVAYVLHDELFLFEQQSTKNTNMPLRCLFYASDTYSVLVKDKNIYGTKMLPLPSATFVVFYNGKQKMDEEGELRLSDAFVKKQEIPNLEVIVKVKNINMGNSRELFEKCRPMRDYMIFVDKVRRYSQEQPLEDAVERTIRECMEEDVMADFLKRNRAEVVKMCLYEYDEERQREFDREEGREEGRDAERIEVARRMLKFHKLSYVEVAEFVGLTVEEVKALDTDEAVIEIKGF